MRFVVDGQRRDHRFVPRRTFADQDLPFPFGQSALGILHRELLGSLERFFTTAEFYEAQFAGRNVDGAQRFRLIAVGRGHVGKRGEVLEVGKWLLARRRRGRLLGLRLGGFLLARCGFSFRGLSARFGLCRIRLGRFGWLGWFWFPLLSLAPPEPRPACSPPAQSGDFGISEAFASGGAVSDLAGGVSGLASGFASESAGGAVSTTTTGSTTGSAGSLSGVGGDLAGSGWSDFSPPSPGVFFVCPAAVFAAPASATCELPPPENTNQATTAIATSSKPPPTAPPTSTAGDRARPDFAAGVTGSPPAAFAPSAVSPPADFAGDAGFPAGAAPGFLRRLPVAILNAWGAAAISCGASCPGSLISIWGLDGAAGEALSCGAAVPLDAGAAAAGAAATAGFDFGF